MAGLIARFMDVDSGHVRVGGVDVRQIASRQLQQHLALVFQQAGALRLSLAQNIALYQPHASEKQIRAAAKAACLDDWIMGLPKGYASVVADDVRLSGGELQRLAIARALLSRAPIMLLDEPTSATDPQTERALRYCTARRRSRAHAADHRPSPGNHRPCQQILVLCEGRIVQRGCHAQLLAVDVSVPPAVGRANVDGRSTGVRVMSVLSPLRHLPDQARRVLRGALGWMLLAAVLDGLAGLALVPLILAWFDQQSVQPVCCCCWG